MIRIENLNFRYESGEEPVLQGVNLRVREGDFVLITGPSGCGKTTLARCLNGLIPHLIPGELSGQISVDGLNTVEHPVYRLASKVGMVFQIPETQLFNLTVEEEVGFGCFNLGLPPEEVSSRVDFSLAAVGMDHCRKRLLYRLSGGEKQLVAIASILAMQPKVMVLDEPLSNLDTKSAKRILAVLTLLNRELGITVLLIEHKTTWLVDVVERVLVMNKGRMVLDGKPSILREERAYLSDLGVRVPGDPQDHSWCPGKKHSSSRNCSPSEGDVIISLEDISFAYDGQKVFENASLKVRQGEFIALVGDNGAGKTTLAHLILGSLRPSKGKIRVSIDGGPRQKIGLLLQNPLEQLFCDTVEEEMAFGLHNFGLPVSDVLNEVLSLTGLLELKERPVQNLSRGQQQRLTLAAVLALRPRILILDEPTLGQDWGHLIRFMDFVKELRLKGTTVVLITHDLEIAKRYADRIVRVDGGRIVSSRHGKGGRS